MEDFSFASFEPIVNLAEQHPEVIKKYYEDNSLHPENSMLMDYLNWTDEPTKPVGVVPTPPPPANSTANLSFAQLIAASRSLTPIETVDNVRNADKPIYVAPAPKDAKAFVARYEADITKAAKELGVPPTTLLAQMANETGWGQHIPGNNFGGIKATKNWTGKTQWLMTTEYEHGKKVRKPQLFRVYDTPALGLQGYVDFLKTQPRYKKIQGVTDPYQAAAIISEAGYATDPNYNKKLNIIIKQIENMKKK